jgi:hypothetical protein
MPMLHDIHMALPLQLMPRRALAASGLSDVLVGREVSIGRSASAVRATATRGASSERVRFD